MRRVAAIREGGNRFLRVQRYAENGAGGGVVWKSTKPLTYWVRIPIQCLFTHRFYASFTYLTYLIVKTHYYCALSFLLLLPLLSWGQSISLERFGQPESRCVGGTGTLQFTTSGNFSPTNAFLVEFSTDGNTFTALPNSVSSSPSSFTLPPSMTRGSNRQLRISSTNPVRYSNSISFEVVGTPTVELLPSTTFPNEPVNPYSDGVLRFRLSGGGSYTMILSDSTRLTSGSLPEGFVFDPLVRAIRSVDYQVLSVQNTCGLGTVVRSAPVSVTVNPVSIRFQRPASTLCTGSTVQLPFETSTPLPAGVSFRAELVYVNKIKARINVPVSGTASPLQLTLPSQLEDDWGVRLRVYDPAKGISVYYGNEVRINKSSPVVARLNQEQVSIPMGGTATISVSLTALQGGGVRMNDGRQFIVSSGWDTFRYTVSPRQATSYSIVEAVGSCNTGTQYSNRTTNIEVRPGFRVDSLSAGEVCAGTPVTLYYSTTPGYTLPSNLWLLLDLGDPVDLVLTQPGQATFVFPETAQSVNSTRLIFYRKNGGGYLSEQPFPFQLKTRPQVTFVSGTHRLDAPQPWSPLLNWTGGGGTTVELASGERFWLNNYQTPPSAAQTRPGFLYVTKSTTYSIASAWNECGRRAQSSQTVVTIANTFPVENRIHFQASTQDRQNACPGSVRWYNMSHTGTYAANNQFRVELSDANGQFGSPTMYTLASGATSFSLALPAQAGLYRLRAASTNPQINSNETTIIVGNLSLPLAGDAKLSLAENPFGPLVSSLTVVPGEAIRALYTFSGTIDPVFYELNDGRKGQGFENMSVGYEPTATTTFRINKLTDQCGRSVRPISSATAVVVPRRFASLQLDDQPFCGGQSYAVSFRALGDFPAGGSYGVQVSEDNRTFRDLPTSGTSSPLSITLPASLVGKSWHFRVIYRVGTTEIVSEATTARPVYGLPNVTLTGVNGEESLSLRNGSSVTLLFRDEGGLYTSAFLTTGRDVGFTRQATLNVTVPGTYSIALAQNQCGYLAGKGQVRVTRGVALSRVTIRRAGFCVNEPVSFSYVMDGDVDAGNWFSWFAINTQTGASFSLGSFSTTTGAVTYAASLPVAQYDLRVVASAPSTTITVSNVLKVQTPVSVSLLPSAQAIYADDPVGVGLLVRASGGLPCSITLSSGEVQPVSFPEEVLTVRPTQTTNYSISQVQNGCGVSGSTGVVSVTVIPAGNTRLDLIQAFGKLCAASSLTAVVATRGLFSGNNVYTLLMLDATGRQATPIGNASTVQSLTGLIPGSISPGVYSFRVSSSNPQHAGSTWDPMLIGPPPTGILTGNTSIFKGDSTRISVALTGTPPWQLTITDLFGPRTFSTSQSPFTLTVRPDTTIGYRLTEVRNSQCGIGSASGTALITVSRLLATEPALPLELRTWPNPTAGTVLLEGELPGVGTLQVRVQTLLGTLVQSQTVQPTAGRIRTQLDLSALPTGTYLLTAEQDGRRSTFKVVKE
jgi:hypothetical protein